VEALVDNDIIVKVARYSLTSEFDRILRGKGLPPPRRCLPTATAALHV